jgi:hypothetical protein
MVVNYLPSEAPRPGQGFADWLGGGATPRLLFLGLSLLVFLGGLGYLTVAVLNLVAGSPFKYLVVDRHGISHRTFFGEKRYSWKDLDEIQPHKISLWRSRSREQRYWIVEGYYGKPGGLRISAGDYLGGGWLFGDVALATDEAAYWLESLRLLARADRLEPDDFPPPPSVLREPIEIDYANDGAAKEPAPDLPHPAERSFGNRTVER